MGIEDESKRLYTQVKQLLADNDVFDFLCEHTFGLLDHQKLGSLRLPQVAPLIENFQAAKSSYPCTAEDIYNIWQAASDPLSRTMSSSRFQQFVRAMFQDFLALYEAAEHDDKAPYDDAQWPENTRECGDNQSVLTDATDLTQLAKELRRLSPRKVRRNPEKSPKAVPLRSSLTKARVATSKSEGRIAVPKPKLGITPSKSSTAVSKHAVAKPTAPVVQGKSLSARRTEVPNTSAKAKAKASVTATATATATPRTHKSEGSASGSVKETPSVAVSSDAVAKQVSPPQAAKTRRSSWSKFAAGDFHNDIHSILTSEEAALRFAREFADDFEDTDFGPREEDPLGQKALGFEANCSWRKVDADDVSPKLPICPGSLADSWFLSALALVMESAFLENLWPRSLREFASKGLYCFRFCKHFDVPVYVIVDNALPFESDKPITAQGVWIALAEKAFAKLHGSYKQLWSGLIDEGIEDITGYPCEKVAISKDFKQNVPQGAIFGFARLEKTDSERSGDMRFVHVEGRNLGLGDGLINTGILRNYLYPVKSVEDNVSFLNPWSDGGWMRDSNAAFSLKMEECIHVFTHVFVVKSLHTLTRQRIDHSWTKETSGGTPIPARKPVPSTPESWKKNPSFRFEIDEEQDIIVCMSQPDPRLTGERFPFPSLEEIFILCMNDSGEPVVFEKSRIVKPHGMSSLSRRRQVQLRMRLNAGKYVLVPSTWEVGIAKPFALTVFSTSAKVHKNE